MKMRTDNGFGLWLIVVVVLAVFIAGCGGDKRDLGYSTNYKTGIAGVELNILNNMPPAQIYEGDLFNIAVKIDNKGGYDLSKGELRIMGLGEAWTPLDKYDAVVPPLVGRSLGFDGGESHIIEFSGKSVMLPPLASEYTSNFIAVMDYDYETAAYVDLCVNPALVVDVKNDLTSCKVKQKNTLSGQGAPIAVTVVEENIIPLGQTTTIEVTFTVEDKGNGELSSPVYIDEVKLANRMMKCSPVLLKPADIKEKNNKVVCRVTEPTGSAYTTTFSALLHYEYRVQKEGTFEVKKFE